MPCDSSGSRESFADVAPRQAAAIFAALSNTYVLSIA
jgi:hypothetical protein